MMEKVLILLAAIICALLPTATGQCQIEGVNPVIPVFLNVQDVQSGVIFRADTTNVNSITSSQHSGDALNGGPYFTAVMEDSQFVLSLSEAFEAYEEAEYTDTMSIFVTLSCAGSTPTANMLFNVHIEDTNNNSPRFIPETYSFSILPPIVPGYELTGCHGDIIARDIDLTTQRIIFDIEENPYFEIEYGGRDPADSKNFFAILRATSVIRSLPDPLTLQISAQDVDLTGDQPRTTFTTITIEADANFDFPEEPKFSEPFYTATYGNDHTITHQDISLSQGYDSTVDFYLTGLQSEYFRVTSDENVITIHVDGALPTDVLESNEHILLVVNAEREYTTGDTATVVVQLPERFRLEFEQFSYSGVITDNVMEVRPLAFVEPGTGVITANIVGGDYDEYFTAEVTGATVTLTMDLLPEQIIERNNFISIVVEATSGTSTTSAVVVFDIVKHDTTTPVFSENFYVGSYDSVNGVQISNMYLSQGYDENVEFILDEDGSTYFELQPNGNSVSLILVTPIPQDVISSQHQLLFDIRATKPRTVGATATISIVLPAARILRFEEDDYRGSIQGEELRSPPITLIEGFQEDVTFSLSGEFANLFDWENTNNVVTLILSTPLTHEDVEANDIIVIILEATGTNAIPSKTAIVLNVDKDDTNTPIFSERIYNGIYFESHEVDVDTVISLSQGYDETVNVFLDGEYSTNFDLVRNGNSHNLIVASPLPSNVMEDHSQLVLTVIASKPNTVGAHATILISLPQGFRLEFEKFSYSGVITDNVMEVQPLAFVEPGTGVITANIVGGDYDEYFTAEVTGATVTLTMNPLPEQIIERNNFISIVVEATSGTSTTSAVVVFDIVKHDTTTPIFSENFYVGSYDSVNGVQISNMYLSQGYDENVEFILDEDGSTYFELQPNGNSVSLILVTPIPQDVISSQHQLLFPIRATKPRTVGATATISIVLPAARILRFEEDDYRGSIQGEELRSPPITLIEGFQEDVTFSLSGEFANLFQWENTNNVVSLILSTPLTHEDVEANDIIVIILEATGTNSIPSKTAIVLNVDKDDTNTPIFSERIYNGIYFESHEVDVDTAISLSQGYDETVNVFLDGDYSANFDLVRNGNSHNLIVTSPLPSNVMEDHSQLVLTVIASKPNTVGAHATILISLPQALDEDRRLSFEDEFYEGTLEGERISLQTIILHEGFREDVVFSLVGDLATFFDAPNTENEVTIELLGPLPADVLETNSNIVLVLEASGDGARAASTVIVFNIIKPEVTTPVFDKYVYSAQYIEAQITVEIINLIQGFDDTVSFRLEGEFSHHLYVNVDSSDNSIVLGVTTPIPDDVINSNTVLALTVIADKPGTLGANAALNVELPRELLQFSEPIYIGLIEDGILQLEDIVLSEGYNDRVTFHLSGEYEDHFIITNISNIIVIQKRDTLTQEILDANTYIVLELEALGLQAISDKTTIILEIVKNSDTAIFPIFSHLIYQGTYSALTGLQLDVDISLSQGFNELVTFDLTGEHSEYFELQWEGNSVTLLNPTPIPSAVLAENHHLIFSIIAIKPGTPGASSAISISLTDDMSTAAVLRFEQISYSGILDENDMQIDQTIRIAATNYEGDFVLDIVGGAHASYFAVSRIDNLVIMDYVNPIPAEILNENAFIVLELEVSGLQAIPGQTTIVIEIIKDPATVVYPIFSHSIYQGTYSALTGLQLDVDISLSQGFNELVTFDITGEHSEYFELQWEGNSVTLLNPTPIPSAVLAENHHLIFSIIAIKPGTPGASSAISISLTDDMSTAAVLRFEQISYSGILDGNDMQIDQTIRIAATNYEGDFVLDIVGGAHASYFAVSRIDNLVIMDYVNPIPAEILNENAVIVLELEVSGLQAISGQTTIVIEIIKDPATVVYPIFSHSIYQGTYSALTGLQLDVDISLSQGFNELVTFDITGEHSEYFELQWEGNSVTLLNPTPIPSAVLAENHHLIFSIIAIKPGTPGASSAISISLTDDMSTAAVLRFEQISYSGILDENDMHIDQTIRIAATNYEGDFVLDIVGGAHASYFAVSRIDNLVIMDYVNPIPEEILNENAFIVLELEVSGLQAISGQTTIVIEIIKDPATVVYPIFSHSIYQGTYSALTGLQLDVDISLSQGFNELVTFDITGEHSEYFELQWEGNSVTLLNPTPIPSAVLAENHHLIFSIIAIKPGTPGASSAISISLTDDMSTAAVLRFEQISYSGILDENDMQIDQTIRIAATNYEGDFILDIVGGAHASYFAVSRIDNLVIMDYVNPIPAEILNENAFIVLELEVSGLQAISGQTTIVIEIIKDPATVVYPIFSHSIYEGTYSALTGLQLDVDISLSQGFNELVTFDITGEHSEYFELQWEGNSVTLLNPTPIPSAVLTENHHLIFSIIAIKPGTPGASSAISISLTDDMSTAAVLRFEQISYSGILDGNDMQIDQTIRIAATNYEGELVLDIVGGAHASYFAVSRIDNLVIMDYVNPIPAEILNENAFIVLELEVSGLQAISGQTTIVIEIIKDPATVVYPIFSHSIYQGTYSALTGLQLDVDISLSQGFNELVTFDITGEHSEYFELQWEGNSVTLLNPTPIPSAVLAENHHLIFSIIAIKPGTPGASSAISISLTDDMSTAAVLRFEQISYSGILDGNDMQIDQTIRIAATNYEGELVLDIVGGAHASYFAVSRIDNLVIMDYVNPIPEEILNENAFIVLELEVSGLQAISGQTTIVIEIIKDPATVVYPIFSHSIYQGTYSALTGLQLDVDISLSQGFNELVTFDITGEHSEYFELQWEGNSVTLLNPTPIPSAVLAENHHLIFSIIAIKPGTPGASSAISISLTDDMSTAAVLRFEQISYSGILDENDMQIDQTIRIAATNYEGDFILDIVGGAHASYFAVSRIDNLVIMDYVNPIPAEILNENAFIVLELEVSGLQAISGQTTIVIEIIKDPATVVYPIFSHSIYEGTYSALTGLQLDVDISLSQGFNELVTFDITGEHSEYFELQWEGNSVTLLNPTPIPSAVLTENHHLIFSIIAIKPGTPGASSAISISLTDDMSTAAVLRFEQISYSGILDGNDMQIDQTIRIAATNYEGELVLDIVGGAHASYFAVSRIDNLVIMDYVNPIPAEILNENAFIVLELEVSGLQAISGQTTIVIEIIKDPATVVYPIFSHSIYQGTYSALTGLQLDVDISLSQGFNELVTFDITGEHSEYFELQWEGNSVTLLNPTPIPSAVLAENHHLIFSIIANKPGTPGASSAISISLTDDMSTAAVLRFEQISYSGILDGNDMQIDQTIRIAATNYEGELVLDIVGGAHASYFAVSRIDNLVIMDYVNPIPAEILNENAFIVLELEVSGLQAISGQTSIVIEIIKDPATVVYPIFSHSIYQGTYSALTGLQLDVDISLSQGFNELVTFDITGEHSEYFELQWEGNSVTLLNPTPIPSAVLAENHHLIFSIIAIKPGTPGASSAISISLTDDMSTAAVLRFEQISYSGILDGNDMQIDQTIRIAATNYEGELVLDIVGGAHASYFAVSLIDNLIIMDYVNPIPAEILNENAFIVLELEVSGLQAISGQTTIVIEIIKDPATVVYPIFSRSIYQGTYSALTGLQLDVDISLSQGFNELVTFDITGEHSEYFELQWEGNSVTLLNPTPIPSAVLAENHHLIFSIIANKPGTPGASSAISISLTDDMSTAAVLRFEQISYSGILDGNDMQIDQTIRIAATNYEGELVLDIVGGAHASYFAVSRIDNLVIMDYVNPIPAEILNENAFIVLELEVSGLQAISGQTSIVIEIIKDPATVVYPIFSHSIYQGTYSALTGLQLDVDISLSQGFNELVTFDITGEHSEYFELQWEGNSVTLLNPTPIPSAVLAENHHLIFSIIAIKPGTPGASSAISISLTDDMSTAAVLRFEQISYSGILDGNDMQIDQTIRIAATNYEGELVLDIVGGAHASYFAVSLIDNLIIMDYVNPIPAEILNENAFIVLELEVSGLQAISGQTTIVIEIIKDPATVVYPIFSRSIYQGTYSALTGLQLDVDISLSQGFNELVTFDITGEHSEYFELQWEGNSVTLLNPTPIPSAVLAENHHLIFSIIAIKPGTPGASSAISISLIDGPEGSVFFERGLYSGSLEQGVASHEAIFLYGYIGTEIHISGDYSSEFVGGVVSAEGQVEVRAAEGASLPAHIVYLPLLLQADTARTALVLSIIHPVSPDPPSVAFEYGNYVLRTDVAHIGLLARVTATASNGETTLYSLVLDNSHLEERLSVSSDGELWLSAPADSGVYQFAVRATTIATQVSAEATVHLTVDSVVICGTDNRVLQPLIVLERDEEEPHDNLIILNDDLAADCSYEFTYRWPSDRDWIYISEQGHISARIIDREDPAIAFMTLSQIQIELVLTCSNDVTISRQRRDVFAQNRTLGSYDYGQSDWILTEGIGYNARRSFVNLIVNDINDNPPIFIGEEDAPIVVGYPVESLLEVVNPSPLITVQATDADIGLNAELVYWSSASELAVSSRTGAVYVRDNAAGQLQSGTIFTISATDLAGAPGGHTGHIDIMVLLLELDNIVVLSIRNALLDDEQEIIKLLSEALQYDIKSLGATVISDQYDVGEELDVSSRLSSKIFYDATLNEALNGNFTKRSGLRQAEVDESGATLRIFIYGLLNSELVEAAQLKSDIENSQIVEELTTLQVQHLQDHLDNIIRAIGSPTSNTALLVSTIVLACLLFIVIMAIGGWFFFRWWKARKYKQFRDSASVSNETLETLPKVEDALRPRPNIEEIKRTERRLKQMLEQPIIATPPVVPLVEIETRNGTMEMPASKTVTFETVSEGPMQPEKQLPIVIQSIDKLKTDEDTEDEDEFGEKLSSRRKSVVTFNEQVEKIITVDNIDPDDDADVVVQRL